MNRNRFLQLLSLVLAGLLARSSAAWAGPPPPAVDLETALQLARDNSPLLDSTRAGIEEARGDLTTAEVFLVDDAYLQVGVGPRFGGPRGRPLQPQFQAMARQRLEVAGQRGKRTRAAKDNLEAARSDNEDEARRLALRVAMAFFDAVAAEERLQYATDNERLASQIEALAQRRVDSGADSPTALNAAKIRTAEARRRTLAAEMDVTSARVILTSVVGLPPGRPLTPNGSLPTPAALLSIEDLVEAAPTQRPDLVAASRRTSAAAHGEAVARAQRWPDMSLGAQYSFEEQDSVILGVVGFWLPSLNRSRGAHQKARATTRRLQAERVAMGLSAEAEIRTSAARLRAANKAVAVYDTSVLTAQNENLRLLREQYGEGKVTYVEVVLLQRELLEAQLGYVQARLDVAKAYIAVLSAAGRPLVSTSPRGEE